MKKLMSIALMSFCMLYLISCGCSKCKAIELMGAGDRIHDTYTFANTGVKIKETNENVYEISGSVEKLSDSNVKKEFKIDEDINHVVAIKLTATDTSVDKDKLEIMVNGNRAYDAEHLNGSDYTFIIIEAKPDTSVSITVNWNGESEKHYIVKFSPDLVLK